MEALVLLALFEPPDRKPWELNRTIVYERLWLEDTGNILELLWNRLRPYTPFGWQTLADSETATGRVVRLSVSGDGDVVIYIAETDGAGRPRPRLVNGNNPVSGGGRLLLCEVPLGYRGKVGEDVLESLRQGDLIRLYGRHVLDNGHGGHAELHPVWRIELMSAEP